MDDLALGLMRVRRRLASGEPRAAPAAPAQVRARDAEADLGSNGLGGLVTVRQRNVEAQGFPAELAGAADGVFLDLPSPWLVRSYLPYPGPAQPLAGARLPAARQGGGRRGQRRRAPPCGATRPASRPWRASRARGVRCGMAVCGMTHFSGCWTYGHMSAGRGRRGSPCSVQPRCL